VDQLRADQFWQRITLLHRRLGAPSGPVAGEAAHRIRIRYRSQAIRQEKMLSMLAENRTRLLAYHFAWPEIGHVAKQGDGFRYYPEGMTL
jgi:hypothetical protein